MPHSLLNHSLKQTYKFCCIYTIEAQRLFVSKTIRYLFTLEARQVRLPEHIRMFLEIAARNFKQAPFYLHLNIGIN